MQGPRTKCSPENDRENSVLREVFDRAKLDALKTALKLEVRIAELHFEQVLAETTAMPKLGRKLFAQVLVLDCLKLIVAIRASIGSH